MRSYFTTRSASACCRLRRSLSVLSMKSSIIPGSWLGRRTVCVCAGRGWSRLLANNVNKGLLPKTTACLRTVIPLTVCMPSADHRPRDAQFPDWGHWQQGASFFCWGTPRRFGPACLVEPRYSRAVMISRLCCNAFARLGGVNLSEALRCANVGHSLVAVSSMWSRIKGAESCLDIARKGR